MESISASILIAEPSNEAACIFRQQLETDYTVSIVDSGQSCLDSIVKTPPDLLILSNRLKDINELEVCKKIRASGEIAHFPIIFVSETSNPVDLHAAYEAGCDEFIGKALDGGPLLLSKVRLLVKHSYERSSLNKQSQDYLNAAMEAMTGSGEMGVIILFLQNSYGCRDYESLGNALFEALTNYNLTATLMIIGNDAPVFMSIDGESHELEYSILESGRDKGRIVESGQRSIYNGNQCSFLIRNMPIEDEARTGRLRDHLATIVVGMDARLKAIDIERNLMEKQSTIRETIDDTRSTLALLDAANKQQRYDHAAVLNDLGENIESAFFNLGLTDEQEEFLTGAIKEAELISDSLYESASDLDAQFQFIISRLTDAMAYRYSNVAQPNHSEVTEVSNENGYQADNSDTVFL